MGEYEYTCTEGAAPLMLYARWPEAATQNELAALDAQIADLRAKLDEMSGYLANVQRYCLLHSERLNAIEQQLSTGD